MARERLTKQITSSVSLEVQQLPAMRALKLLHKLTKALAPALAAVGKGQGTDLMDVDLGNLAGAAEKLFANFSQDDLEEVTRQLLEESLISIDGGAKRPTMLDFDGTFGGKIDLLLKAIAFALEANYPFLKAARGALADRVAAAMAAPSNSPNTSDPSGLVRV